MKVFISSTYLDLKEYREVAIHAVNSYKCGPLTMECFMSQPKEPEEVCEEEIQECDIFVGIYAHRFGFCPKRRKKSITQMEYELARKLGKDCLCFIVKEDFPWNLTLCEPEKFKELNAFINKVKQENTCSFFTTPNDFGRILSTSLGNLLLKKQEVPLQKERLILRDRLIPIAPTPFIAHPYPLPENFTGRTAEKALLSNWLYNEKEPMLVLEAIGGMGKTALSWVWLNEEVMEKSDDLDGILWWSFYDNPFETFIPHLFHYLTSKEVKIDSCALPGDVFTQLNSILFNNRFLLILDGFERALRGYAGMSAMYIQEKGLSHDESAESESDWERRQREPVHQQAARFLKTLASCKTRTLMTTRLFPTPLEEISGVRHRSLCGLSRVDAVRFLKEEGIHGSRPEMEQAGEVYHFHPLMLKLLSSAIKKSRERDISAAFRLDLIDRKEPQKIIETSYNLLSEDEKRVATHISVFRTGFGFETALAIFPQMEKDQLWEILCGLKQLGFLFYDEKGEQFDLHPILRSFLYSNLTAKEAVHQQAVEYFKALPKEEKVVILEDLAPVIELYYHLAGAGRFDEMCDLFINRLLTPIYYQLSNYSLNIELLKGLFPDGGDRLPRLKKARDRAWALNALGISYSRTGQSAKAVQLKLKTVKIDEVDNNRKAVAIDLGNLASDQTNIGQISVAAAHLQKCVLLSQEIEDEFKEAIGHQELGLVLAYQGRSSIQKTLHLKTVPGSTSEGEWDRAFELFEKGNYIQSLSVVSIYRCISALMQARLAQTKLEMHDDFPCLVRQAIQQAHRALEFAEKYIKMYPVPRDFVWTYWLLAEALILGKSTTSPLSVKTLGIEACEINLFDEHFQEQVEKVRLEEGNELEVAERFLHEALRRCRKTNLVELEPGILLASVRLEWARLPLDKRCVENLAVFKEMLRDAFEIAERAGYRLTLADIHLFCAETLLPIQEGVLLGLSAREHLEKAREYALDVSEFSHLFQSKDPHFYDGIPEYEMLKRGITKEERIENGYWMAYKTAEALEKGLQPF